MPYKTQVFPYQIGHGILYLNVLTPPLRVLVSLIQSVEMQRAHFKNQSVFNVTLRLAHVVLNVNLLKVLYVLVMLEPYLRDFSHTISSNIKLEPNPLIAVFGVTG